VVTIGSLGAERAIKIEYSVMQLCSISIKIVLPAKCVLFSLPTGEIYHTMYHTN
jgi:hypothetical protein